MITVTVNGNSYYGFGPTPRTANHFAEFEAYNALNPLPVEEAERVRSFIPDIGEVSAHQGNVHMWLLYKSNQ